MKLVCYMHTYAAAAESLQSCPTLCDLIDGSPQGSPSLGFSRQEDWSGLPLPSPVHTHIPSLLGRPPTTPVPRLGHHRPLRWAPCAIWQVRTRSLFLAVHGSVSILTPIARFVPLSPSLSVSTCHSPCQHLYPCPANRFICTIFLDPLRKPKFKMTHLPQCSPQCCLQ